MMSCHKRNKQTERRSSFLILINFIHIAYDIKLDMEARKPMDRLLCGDVGFGKTEVALRAAFKAWTAS